MIGTRSPGLALMRSRVKWILPSVVFALIPSGANAGSCDSFTPGMSFKSYYSSLGFLADHYDEVLARILAQAIRDNEPLDSEIDDDLRVAIASYTNFAHKGMNQALWNGTLRKTRLVPFYRCLNKALDLLPRYIGPTSRIVESGFGTEESKKHVVGNTVIYPGFTSASSLENWIELVEKSGEYTKVFHAILYLSSYAGRDISKYSQAKSEKEILFPAGTCFQIRSRSETAYRVEIHADEVPCPKVNQSHPSGETP
ncbi:MAG: hypothetical protein H7301_10225 [Cryobacterium sp.]|nr:hypothetical protein [Oligoflexia bacterium]